MQSETSTVDLIQLLRSHFPLTDFRRGQREVIECIAAGRDTMAVMPTGGGKSLCYQLAAYLKEGLVIVISPLISLMEDQVRALRALGIPAAYVHSGQTMEEKRQLFREMEQEKHFLLYVSPERVQKEGFGTWIAKKPVSLFAIDEAHCVSQWGPDFRKDYYRLAALREMRPDVPILALTATATPTVLGDISRQLGLRDPARHVYGFYRPNLYCQVEVCDDENTKLNWIQKALEQNPEGRCIIYCGTRKQTEALQEILQNRHAGVGFYHAGLSAEERTRVQKDYEAGNIRILAATNAFGMGIDHPDVRLVVHYQIPSNIESYYQEMGRAGRDGNHSTCLLLYAKRDKGLHSYFIQNSGLEAAMTRQRWRALDTIVQFAEGGECRHAGILTYFRDTQRIKSCGHCDICDPESPRKIAAPVYEFRPSTILRKKSSKSKSGGATATNSEPLSAEDQLRVEVLRTWRKEYADANDIPAFIVFSNKTLDDLARKNPSTLEELEEVYGFGPHKVENLGELVLAQLSSCRG